MQLLLYLINCIYLSFLSFIFWLSPVSHCRDIEWQGDAWLSTGVKPWQHLLEKHTLAHSLANPFPFQDVQSFPTSGQHVRPFKEAEQFTVILWRKGDYLWASAILCKILPMPSLLGLHLWTISLRCGIVTPPACITLVTKCSVMYWLGKWEDLTNLLESVE